MSVKDTLDKPIDPKLKPGFFSRLIDSAGKGGKLDNALDTISTKVGKSPDKETKALLDTAENIGKGLGILTGGAVGGIMAGTSRALSKKKET